MLRYHSNVPLFLSPLNEFVLVCNYNKTETCSNINACMLSLSVMFTVRINESRACVDRAPGAGALHGPDSCPKYRLVICFLKDDVCIIILNDFLTQ